MKRKLITSLCLTLCSVMFVGCGASTNSSIDSNSSDSKPLNLNVMIWDRGDSASGTTVENNTTTQFIKEAVLKDCNINVNFVPVPRSGSDDKVNVMMAGGNAPDIIFTYSRNMFGDFAIKGGLTDLTGYIDEFGSQIKETLEEDILSVGVIDGKQFAIPAKRDTQKIKHVGYIRKDWVDKLGKDLPTNKQELIDILYEFKEKDPGNVGANLVPWAMGGNQGSEKYYLNFAGSYVDLSDEKDQYTYYASSKVLHPEAKDGLKVMNQLYNNGIIKKDFAVDTNDDIYKQDITNGYTGFIMEDNFRPIDAEWIKTLQQNVPTAEFVPINILDDPNGIISTPADPLYGMYIMVPKVNEKNAEASIKYLNWLANIENSMKIRFTPDYKTDDAGVPIGVSKDVLASQGYANTPNDYTILTQYWAYSGSKDGVVASWSTSFPFLDKAYYENAYDQLTSNLYNEPVIQSILESETKYLSNIEKLSIELAYTCISAPTDKFESVYNSGYEKLNQAGLQEVLNERSAYYDNNVANK